MGSGRRVVLATALVVGALTWSLGAGPAVSAGPARATAPRWHLVDAAQHGCFSTRVHDSYFGIWISGTWTRPINVGASALPAGARYDTSYAPIPPGTSTGVYSLAYVHVS